MKPETKSLAELPAAASSQSLGSGAMFDRIAHRYDLLNRLMSLGLDQRWRKKTARALELGPDARVLDLATGTADLALVIAGLHRSADIVGVDPSNNMIAVGQRKVADADLSGRIRLEVGDAQAVEFPDHEFDGVCMAFGIRNVPDRPRALAEMARVTRPGGRIAILELSEPKKGLMGALARFYVHVLVPRLGALLSGSREYRYLQRSIEAFPPAQEFANMMTDAGIEVLRVEPLTFGACHLYVGTPIATAGKSDNQPGRATP